VRDPDVPLALARLTTPAGATRLLVVLHGHGDEPTALADQVDALLGPRGRAGRAALAAPTGPTRTASGLPAWFPTAAGDDGPSLVTALDALEETIDEAVAAAGTDAASTVVLGSSQGASTALALAFRAGSRCRPAAVAGLAAWLPDEPGVDWAGSDRAPGGSAVPALLAHGEDDEVVPLLQGRAATRALRRWGVPVTLRLHPGGHRTPPAVLADAVAWLLDR
jgi:phospholipase/carboxylesterase